MDIQNIIGLAKALSHSKKNAPVAYSAGNTTLSYEEMNNTLREELNALAGTLQLFRKNSNELFTIMEAVIDDYLPRKVLESYGVFANFKQFKQGEKAVFRQKITAASKRRAKRFITKVGLAGVYEVFRLDGQTYEVPVTAYGGAAQIGFEEFLDGGIEWTDLLDILMEGLDEAVFKEIAKSLAGIVNSIQPSNKVSQAGFNQKEMDKLLAIADSYGNGNASIYCTFEFAATMIPDASWASNGMKEQVWSTGFLSNYKGHKVIILPQSFEDETNTKKVLDPQVAWIISGENKPVNIAFEGQTAIRESQNHDWSREIHAYKKFGVSAVVHGNLCVYVNTSLTK